MTKTLKIFQPLFFIFLSLFALVLLFGNFGYAVQEGINLWIACVIPTLFPYLFITTILSGLNVTKVFALKLSPLTRRIFNVNGMASFALFMSLIAGYPIGAKIVADLRKNGQLSPSESVRAACFCSTPSPIFLIASVGKISFNSTLLGWLLFFINILSCIAVGFVFSFYKRKDKCDIHAVAPPTNSADNLLYDGVMTTVLTLLCVGALITLFYLLTEVLLALKVLSPIICVATKVFGSPTTGKGVVLGLFECTRAVKILSNDAGFLSLPLCASLCGFGGLSVIAQSVAYLKSAKIKIAPFFLAKIFSAIICFILGLIFSLIFFGI